MTIELDIDDIAKLCLDWQRADLEKLRDELKSLRNTLLAYTGPSNDLRIGWQGRFPSRPELFQCECCNAEHKDYTKIKHRNYCTAALLIAEVIKIENLKKVGHNVLDK